ncbi:MAG: hypothetical protein M0D57_04560 [Sphingobacteriales bacterium JAD_PAG50586_3]|nr:MAG: hypothetical protein M0D57_04560 [Sphingobacteriales bacterium JAD_PAG50586_3]
METTASYNHAARERLFKSSLSDFYDTHCTGLLDNLLAQEGLNAKRDKIEAAMLQNGEKLFISYYENIRENHLKKVIATKSGEMDRIDIYKILSATEYTIMYIKPILLRRNKEYIIHDNDPALSRIENVLNARFAFKFAIKLLTSWNGQEEKRPSYVDIFSNDVATNEIFNYKEAARVKNNLDVMSIAEEHIAVIAMSKINLAAPIFTNATWWRMLCYLAFTKSGNSKRAKKA